MDLEAPETWFVSLCQVKQQNFGWGCRLNGHSLLVRDGHAISSEEIIAQDAHFSLMPAT
jgi:hypothetical protein